MSIQSETVLERPRAGVDLYPVAASPDADSERTVPSKHLKVGIIGTGYIANYHAEVLQEIDDIEITAALDTNPLRLNEFCQSWNIKQGSTSPDEFLNDYGLDVVHVLTPPATHLPVTRSVLEAGISALVEKPFVLNSQDCRELQTLAAKQHVMLGVNHNAVYHPAMQKLLKDISRHRLGPIQHVVSVNNLPLAQLSAGQHDHWMFQKPENILFEQATHPLSQVCEILGDVREARVFRTGTRKLRNGLPFSDTWQIGLRCERGTAQLFLAWGKDYPETRMTVIGADGIGHLDLDANTYTLDQQTKYLPAMDRMLRGSRMGGKQLLQTIGEFSRYVTSTLRITGRRDPYYLSMKSSVQAFYDHLRTGREFSGVAEKAQIVISAIEQAVATVDEDQPENVQPVISHGETAPPADEPTPDSEKKPILVIGGTGFIGRHLIRSLEQRGERVRVLVRRPEAVTAFAGARGVQTVLGDVRDPASIEQAVAGCDTVYLLVSGAPETWQGFEEVFLDGTRTVADACLKHDVKQLLYTSSITAYHLGDPKHTICESSAIDQSPDKRCHYSRAKILVEQILNEYYEAHNLPVTVFRPGFVIGQGTPPSHLGVGEWPAPTHCVSWGRSIDHPLPFVLVGDVVSALLLALRREDLSGESFNLVGDVRPTAREYVQLLRNEMQRDIRLHRQSLTTWSLIEWFKWMVKAVARKPNNTRLTYHELAYRSSRSPFDCSQTQNTLGWAPVNDLDEFIRKGIRDAL